MDYDFLHGGVLKFTIPRPLINYVGNAKASYDEDQTTKIGKLVHEQNKIEAANRVLGDGQQILHKILTETINENSYIRIAVIAHIFNFISTSSTLPSKWKMAKILPLPKRVREPIFYRFSTSNLCYRKLWKVELLFNLKIIFIQIR